MGGGGAKLDAPWKKKFKPREHIFGVKGVGEGERKGSILSGLCGEESRGETGKRNDQDTSRELRNPGSGSGGI